MEILVIERDINCNTYFFFSNKNHLKFAELECIEIDVRLSFLLFLLFFMNSILIYFQFHIVNTRGKRYEDLRKFFYNITYK